MEFKFVGSKKNRSLGTLSSQYIVHSYSMYGIYNCWELEIAIGNVVGTAIAKGEHK